MLKIIIDDTDVFPLACNYFQKDKTRCQAVILFLIIMESTRKQAVIKVLHKQPLIHLLDSHFMIEDVIEVATLFLGSCYGTETGTNKSEKR